MTTKAAKVKKKPRHQRMADELEALFKKYRCGSVREEAEEIAQYMCTLGMRHMSQRQYMMVPVTERGQAILAELVRKRRRLTGRAIAAGILGAAKEGK